MIESRGMVTFPGGETLSSPKGWGRVGSIEMKAMVKVLLFVVGVAGGCLLLFKTTN